MTYLIKSSIFENTAWFEFAFDLDDPSGKHNYYIMEFASGKDIIFFASVILNVVLIAMVCYLGAKGCKGGPTTYSKVDVDYSIEDEKL